MRKLLALALIPIAAMAQDTPEMSCQRQEPLYTNSVYTWNIEVCSVSTNKVATRIGWCAPGILEGEPMLTEYRVYLNGEMVGFYVPSAIPVPGTDTIEEGDVTWNWRWGTNTLWMTAVNELGAESEPSQGLELIFDRPRRPTSMHIEPASEGGIIVSIIDVPDDVGRVDLAVSKDLIEWGDKLGATFYRSEATLPHDL